MKTSKVSFALLYVVFFILPKSPCAQGIYYPEYTETKTDAWIKIKSTDETIYGKIKEFHSSSVTVFNYDTDEYVNIQKTAMSQFKVRKKNKIFKGIIKGGLVGCGVGFILKIISNIPFQSNSSIETGKQLFRRSAILGMAFGATFSSVRVRIPLN